MSSLNPASISYLTRAAIVVLTGVAVTACGTYTDRAVPVEAETPSVTYEYTNDQGLVDASFRAEEYCRQYNSWPGSSRIETVRGRGGRVTFQCDRERIPATRTASLPPNTAVTYDYRDEQSLIDATIEAQRHCANMGANARSSTVSTRGGVRTVVFECVRAP